MKEFRLRFHWNLFPRVKLTIFHHCFRQWLGAAQATSHYLKQWWLVYWRIYASFGLNESTQVTTWIGNHVHCKVWDEFTYPIPDCQRYIQQYFHHTLYWTCDYLAMMELQLIHVSYYIYSQTIDFHSRQGPISYRLQSHRHLDPGETSNNQWQRYQVAWVKWCRCHDYESRASLINRITCHQITEHQYLRSSDETSINETITGSGNCLSPVRRQIKTCVTSHSSTLPILRPKDQEAPNRNLPDLRPFVNLLDW